MTHGSPADGRSPVKLLLDEHMSPDIAQALRERDYDVVAVGERHEWMALSDDDVIQLASREHRAVVTSNLRDYRPRAGALVSAGAGHYGMVFVPWNYRRTRRDIGRMVTALAAILDAYPAEDDLRNGETWLA